MIRRGGFMHFRMSLVKRLAYLAALSILCSVIFGCGGVAVQTAPSTISGQPNMIAVTPTTISLNPGDVVTLTATVEDINSTALTSFTPTWASSDPQHITVDTNGDVCAGTWDVNFIVCTPPVNNLPANCTGATCQIASYNANITAMVPGVTSPPVAANIHSPIANISVIPQTPPTNPCISTTLTEQFMAVVKDIHGNDITSTIPPAAITDTTLDCTIG